MSVKYLGFTENGERFTVNQEWWQDSATEICTFHIPTGGGDGHVCSLHGRPTDFDQPWEYAIVQWWHKSPTLWLSWRGDFILGSSPDLMVQGRTQ